MSATQLNNELSKEVHKTIYIHVVKTGGNSSNNPYGGGAWGGGFSGTINGRNQFAMGGGARVISSSNQ
jgi:hypothetical protein